ncbi:glycosidase hydrolase [Cupriavidus basilensis OR16]|uniref:Glycosidase hydrolase n=1 Tax=Cupriavidus basilensis OR16 TaxID=1127483 RepID=H1S918_9BURK|nr:glycosidase hydrolase [Cupriavidus basilensis OR16]
MRFRLWAPDAAASGQRIRLEIAGMGPVPMCAAAPGPDECQGWLEAIAPCCPGARYWFRLDDGSTVPDPASRAQAIDIDGPSLVCDPHAYTWCHPYWHGRPWHEAIIYEMHVGLCGGYAGATRQLPRLAALGFTAVELMPLAEFPGARNWGYDGVLPFAPECSYGKPDDLRALVDCAHGLGMMVLLDVVYNHFGPEGNFLHQYASAFFRGDVRTPWGPAIDFRQPEVRRFFTENALYWLEDFRFDGLRLDAVHAIVDEGWLRELADEVRARHPGRHVHLVLENDDNDASLLAAGFDAQWNDDGHHALHVLLTGERDGYYGDYARPAGEARADDAPATPALAHLARVLAEGFAYQGEVSPTRGIRRGQASAALAPTAFVLFLQNHDQTGNRALGERFTRLARPDALRAAVLLQLLGPRRGVLVRNAVPVFHQPPAQAGGGRARRPLPGVRHRDGLQRSAARGADPRSERPSNLRGVASPARRRQRVEPLLPRAAGHPAARPGAAPARLRNPGLRIVGEAALAASWRWAMARCSRSPGRLLAQSREGAAQALADGALPAATAIACLDAPAHP